MSQSMYLNQFEKSAAIGSLDLKMTPDASVMTVRFDPTDTSTTSIKAGEGMVLTDLGANDINAQGLPLVTKRTHNYDAIYGIKIFNIKKNDNIPGDVFEVATTGAVMFLQCKAAVRRGYGVALNVSSSNYIGQVEETPSGSTPCGIALDKGAIGDIIRVEIHSDNMGVSAT